MEERCKDAMKIHLLNILDDTTTALRVNGNLEQKDFLEIRNLIRKRIK